MMEVLILLATFVGVLLLSTLVMGKVVGRREVSSRLAEAAVDGGPVNPYLDQVAGTLGNEDSVYFKHYFDVVRNDKDKNSLPNRLIRAGFFSPNAKATFQAVRFAVTLLVILAVFLSFDTFFPGVTRTIAIVASLFLGSFAFFISAIVLERRGVTKERAYRRLFPDFMDMLIICVDAGLSIEAAADRVAREFMATRPDFGLHLSIMMLEVRGGRRLRDALSNLADRLNIDEARSLAVLFRQSEELGSSVTKSLRVYSDEMRRMRILRAEEKANALPIKMLFPLAAFLFPLSLIIVLVPVVMRVVALLVGLTPAGG